MEPKFSAGVDKDQLTGKVEALLRNNWTLDEDRMGLQKTYYFKTYTKCMVC